MSKANFPRHARLVLVLILLGVAAPLCAEPPHVSYIFPAGGQRGTKVDFRVGGHYLHEQAPLQLDGPGVKASSQIKLAEKTIWFEGPALHFPNSSRKEDYPKDYLGQVEIAADAPLGARRWRVWTSQGVTAARPFVVGDLPEIVEHEIDGDPVPVAVKLPLTINGRIFPREDVDEWTFQSPAGRSITCAVAAAAIDSPLDARLEIIDPDGRVLAESTGRYGPDPLLSFTTGKAGTYRVRISDINAGGLQHYVYRLTITDGPWIKHVYPMGGKRGQTIQLTAAGQALPSIPLAVKIPTDAGDDFTWRYTTSGRQSNPVVLEVGDLEERLESEPNNTGEKANTAAAPGVANGRIDKPGDVDCWAFQGVKGKPLELEVRAGRLGSPLDSVLTVLDQEGKQLATSDDVGGATDSKLRFVPKVDGQYIVQVSERFSSRGGPAFAYRLQIAPPSEKGDFSLQLPADALSVDRGKEQKLQITLQRIGGFKEAIQIVAEGLPKGVTVAPLEVKGNKPKVQLVIQAEETASVDLATIRIIGKAQIDGQTVARTATLAAKRGAQPVDTLALAVAMPTPFTFAGQYAFDFVARGAIHRKPFVIERNGYEGPLEIRLADRQGRHLQGVQGKTIIVPAGNNEFLYPIYLPPWMELGRTSRTVLMATGQVKDEQGRLHKVCYTIGTQNHQIICRVSPALIRLTPKRQTIAAVPGTSASLKVRVQRDPSLTSPIEVRLVPPKHMQDITAEAVTVAPGQEEATLVIRFGKSPGPLNMPLLIRATGRKGADPVIGETHLEIVIP